MKEMIKEWNTKVFKNVFKQKQDVLEKIENLNSFIIQKGLLLLYIIRKNPSKKNGRSFAIGRRFIGDKNLVNYG